jgi:hypothetical protein
MEATGKSGRAVRRELEDVSALCEPRVIYNGTPRRNKHTVDMEMKFCGLTNLGEATAAAINLKRERRARQWDNNGECE